MLQPLHKLTIGANKLKFGLYSNSYVEDEPRLKLLKDPRVLRKHDFKKYFTNNSTRVFRSERLALYPWLSYLAVSKSFRLCIISTFST